MRPTGALLLVLVFSASTFFGLGFRELWEPDEGRYADIASRMAATGDWILPTLNGMPHLDKPPFAMWTTSLGYLVFGKAPLVSRLTPWLAGVLLLLTAWAFARRDEEKDAKVTVALLGASGLWWALSGILNLDMPIAATITLSLWAYWQAVETKLQGWSMGFWLMMGIGFLTKGLIGIVIPVGVVVASSLLERKPANLRPLLSLPGMGIAAAVTLPWLVLMEFRVPGFLEFFIIHEHFARFATESHNRSAPAYYFLIVILIGMFPWTAACFAPDYWRRQWQALRTSPQERFLAVWFVIVLGFFSASKSKLPGYILPLLVPAALLLSNYWSQAPQTKAIRWVVRGWTLFVIVVGAVANSWNFYALYMRRDPYNGPVAVFVVLVTMVFIVLSYWSRQKRHGVRRTPVLLSCSAIAVAWIGVASGLAALDDVRSTRAVATALQQRVTSRDVTIIADGTYPRTLPFYLERDIYLTDTQGAHFYTAAQRETMDLPMVLSNEEVRGRIASGAKVILVLPEKRWERETRPFYLNWKELYNWGSYGGWHLVANFMDPIQPLELTPDQR